MHKLETLPVAVTQETCVMCRMTFLNGLWAGQASANSDFAAIIWQLKLLGFNAIRLPFLFDDLQAPAQPIQGAQGPAQLLSYCGLATYACTCPTATSSV
jgi:hypothetical protein